MFAASVLSPGSKLGFYLTNAKKAGEKAHDFQYGPLCIFGLADDQGRNASKQRSKPPVGSAFGPNIGFVRGSKGRPKPKAGTFMIVVVAPQGA